jgi:hypothetical protein
MDNPLTSADYVSIISSSIQALATAILVGVTIYQARQTNKTIESMDKNSKAEFLPVLMLGMRIQECNETTLSIELTNEGVGLAKRPVIINFPGTAPLTINSISAGESGFAKITYQLSYILQLPVEQRKICVEYHDIFSRKIKTEAELVELNNLGTSGNGKGIGWNSWIPLFP